MKLKLSLIGNYIVGMSFMICLQKLSFRGGILKGRLKIDSLTSAVLRCCVNTICENILQ
ncbi:MAG: hypothetical protein ACI845_001475 [Gammaproteobacteria bacterium]|jgi:hypothetical protein